MKARLNLCFPIKKNNPAKKLKTVLTFCSSASICTVTAHICNKLISLFHYILSHPLISFVVLLNDISGYPGAQHSIVSI